MFDEGLVQVILKRFLGCFRRFEVSLKITVKEIVFEVVLHMFKELLGVFEELPGVKKFICVVQTF